MSYQKLLLTAREQANARLKQKGLGPRKRKFRDTEEDTDLLSGKNISGKSLVPQRVKQDVPEEDDFMTSFYNKLYAQNKELKQEVSTQTAEVGSKLPEPSSESGTDVGIRLKQDIQEIFGLEDHQAAAIVGNLDHETGSFKFMQELNPLVEGSRGGYGFAQWTGDRRVAFENWAKENGMDPSSYDANLGFLVHEFQTDDYFKKVMGRLEKTTTVDEATKVFSDGYLKPGVPKMNSRLKKSRGYVGK